MNYFLIFNYNSFICQFTFNIFIFITYIILFLKSISTTASSSLLPAYSSSLPTSSTCLLIFRVYVYYIFFIVFIPKICIYYIIIIFNFTNCFMNELHNSLDNNPPIYNNEEVEENLLEITIDDNLNFNQHATIQSKKNRSIVHSNFTLDERINKYKCNHCKYVF